METVFHDVPFVPGLKTFPKGKLEGLQHSRIELAADLKLVDLTSKALRLLGVARNRLIDTEKDQYPVTRQWAQVIHAQNPEAQGLYWVSRQDDTAVAIVLFGDRVRHKALSQHEQGHELTAHDVAYSALVALAEKIGVLIVQGR
jgi:hypothetical protein